MTIAGTAGSGREQRRSDPSMDRRSFLRSVAVGGAALAAGTLLDACGSPGAAQHSTAASSTGSASGTPRRGGDLRVGLTGGGSTDTLNPFDGGISAIGTARAQQLYQPLIQLGNNAQLQYVLAEEIVPNGTTSNWIIKLRKGVSFHDGKPFGADDVIYTLRTILTQKLGGATVLTPVDVKGLKKLDDLTVEVPMTSPFGSFPQQLASFWYFLYIAPDGWKQANPPNGTGPFKYKSFTPGQESVFVRNDHYWKAGLPYLDSVTIQDYTDPTSVQNALVSKVIDCTGQLSGAQMKSLQQSSGIVALPSRTGAIQPFTMRVDRAPFNDVNVRQAFRYIVDRPELIAASLGGFGWVAADVTSPYDPDYDQGLHRQQDIPLARHLLKKAGYDNDLKVSLDTSLGVSSTALSMAQVFAQQASAAGVTVTINQISATTFFSNDYTKVPFAQIYYDYSPYLAQVAQTFLPTSPFPETHFNDPRYTNLYYEANKTRSPAVRKEIEHEMQQIDFTQGGYIIPCFVDSLDAYSSKLAGYETGKVGEPLGNFNFEDFWFRS
ncbi:peptide ABC transporter substrate-binding protein [Acidimicrobiaceae bacterium USS-CC1]|uniref:Peptide ABC transporter substrate-binding protein n=1 Tax=Acidiferrimicrobium australe TaxID=2664430 RepID=A0ABW9QUK2_9ACTN|nr:peptide ABC transporter substrate-binding protein [Acidiferrimicrobium australe]